ncbi:hypothetical protein UFOVP935_46 [uncultured Caudovirales phage]|uniref:Uncharacterized protein n=1 Tax=uncultured Caudovirales phage TaxID=2100421 RepID=A0A6J5PU43_9CAUD|nr:hypothetical protein UFOVP935_46 [uncultured Caudovirales phage]
MSLKPIENSGLDPLLWAKRPQSQNAWDLIVAEAKVDPRFKAIVEKHIADGVCDEALNLQYVWSFAAQNFVRPAWYVRANGERAAA